MQNSKDKTEVQLWPPKEFKGLSIGALFADSAANVGVLLKFGHATLKMARDRVVGTYQATRYWMSTSSDGTSLCNFSVSQI